MVDSVIEKAAKINPVPFSSAVAYSENQDQLVTEVNTILTGSSDVKKLIGQKPLSVMYDNHKNHAAFMSNVFKLNDFELMSKVIIWVYKTYHVQGFSYDYFPAAMKSWIEALGKHLDPSKTGPLVEVYQWIIQNHEQIIEESLSIIEPPLFIDQRWQ